MYQIGKITQNALQEQSLVLPNGTVFTIRMRFVPMQLGWFFDSIVYGDFEIRGMRICVSPNMLLQFKNQIPFGLACFSNVGPREPQLQEDFSTGAFSMYFLDSDEVAAFADYIEGGALPA